MKKAALFLVLLVAFQVQADVISDLETSVFGSKVFVSTEDFIEYLKQEPLDKDLKVTNGTSASKTLSNTFAAYTNRSIQFKKNISDAINKLDPVANINVFSLLSGQIKNIESSLESQKVFSISFKKSFAPTFDLKLTCAATLERKAVSHPEYEITNVLLTLNKCYQDNKTNDPKKLVVDKAVMSYDLIKDNTDSGIVGMHERVVFIATNTSIGIGPFSKMKITLSEAEVLKLTNIVSSNFLKGYFDSLGIKTDGIITAK